MKKFFALVLALVMALSLVACGDKKDDSGDVTAEHTDTTTVAVGAVILARDDVSSDDVYKFVADIFDNAASLTTSHAKYGELSLEYGASITSVPYHPGAAKYFAEKGFEVAAVKDGAGNTDSRNLRFVTGGESGTYYAFGSVIAQHATNNAGVNVVGLVGNGSQANVQELVDGTADFAFCQSDVMAYAYNGTNLFESKVEGFSTVAVGAVILARDDVSSDDVYKFVADIFDNAASLTTSHAKYGELSLEYGASITSVPYHPGAAKYFSEKGFEVASVKDGAGNTESRNLRFVTGGESGTYYAFGSVIAQHATNNAGINVVGLVGNGSQGNVQELVDGTADFAFCQSDVMAYAYNGTNLFESKVEGFSTVAALYMEQVQIVTTNPAIKTVADLAGKSVSIGAPGSGVYFNAIDVLGAYGLTENDIKPTYQSFGDSADALKNGQIDAAFIVAGAPTTAVTDLATTKDTYLVSLDSEHIAKLLETSDYYTETVIAKDVYFGD